MDQQEEEAKKSYYSSSSNNSTSFEGRPLIAYRLSSPSSSSHNRHNSDRLFRCDWAPGVLVFLLVILTLVASAQILLIHYGDYGGYGYGYGYGYGPGGAQFLGKFGQMVSPPPRINLHSLLNRNVPSMSTSYKLLQGEMSVRRINQLLTKEEWKWAASSSSPGRHRRPSMRMRTRVQQEAGENASSSSSPRNRDNNNVLMTMMNTSSSSSSTGLSGGEQQKVIKALPDCPVVPSGLVGKLFANQSHTLEHSSSSSNNSNRNDDESYIRSVNPQVRPGGTYRPSHCHSRHHVAIIIPYRDRTQHLYTLLSHLHPILQRQQLNYRIYVIEQYGNLTFNKARIMNIAFVTAWKQDPTYGCFIFHDVDLIPEDDRNMYSCPQQPRHMSVAIDEMNYVIPYDELVGGVFAIRTEQFFQVNGYSNLYWGWGAEDDDMAYRLQHVGLKISRPPPQIGRYRMIKHTKRPAVDGRIRYRLLWTGIRRYKIDGINSLDSLNYKILSIDEKPLYTHIMTDIGVPPPGF